MEMKWHLTWLTLRKSLSHLVWPFRTQTSPSTLKACACLLRKHSYYSVISYQHICIWTVFVCHVWTDLVPVWGTGQPVLHCCQTWLVRKIGSFKHLLFLYHSSAIKWDFGSFYWYDFKQCKFICRMTSETLAILLSKLEPLVTVCRNTTA